MTLEEFAWPWHWREVRYLKASTARVRRDRLRRICAKFGDRDLASITWPEVRDWVRGMEIGRGASNNLMGCFRVLMDAAQEDGLIEASPLEGKRLKIVSRTADKEVIDPFDADERAALLAACEGQIKNLFQTMLWTGLRPSEAMALQWDNIDFPNSMIRVVGAVTTEAKEIERTKTKASKRVIKMLRPAREALEDQPSLSGCSFVFLNPHTEKPWDSDRQIRAALIKACKQAGVRYRHPYMLRHTYASMMLTAGEDIGWIASQMGHRNPVLTGAIYAKWIPADGNNSGSKAEALFPC